MRSNDDTLADRDTIENGGSGAKPNIVMQLDAFRLLALKAIRFIAIKNVACRVEHHIRCQHAVIANVDAAMACN